ncbi:NUDIX domain-containing protein [Pseudomonas sp. LD120]|uniref:NUDIX hydrolase n=1 Tax=Pseudomonas sp. LD120 TaxID=485751 RepID=UPI00135A1955|nr:NUDIX domain-containing protein [Pseudomonas sp. LD120]KAF0864574.1 NUDIX domain-containing protein [Pseudomonas sp. LD120]
MLVNKACPVVLRHGSSLEILAFRHPLAGLQLVKGTLEPGESSAVAAVRELLEEAGVQGEAVRQLGIWHSGFSGQVWAFHERRVAEGLPERWQHACGDDGGHRFSFFWHPLGCEPSAEWHPLFQGALNFLRERRVSLQVNA